jgi:hypothetical protein
VGDELKLAGLSGRTRSRAIELAETYLAVARDHVGRTRGAFEQSCDDVSTSPRERKLSLGLRKLVEDRCAFEVDERVDARELRRTVFLEASARRRALALGEVFDRDALLADVAGARGLGETPGDILRGLYADLPEAAVLTAAPAGSGETLVDGYDLAQAQAVLLRATRVTAEVRCQNPAAYRYLFGKIKFHRLLFTLHRLGDGGFRVELSGPYALFSSVTKYGLQLALVLPAIRQCDTWSVRAHLLWGKDRRPLKLVLAGTADRPAGDPPGTARPRGAHLPDEVAELAARVRDSGAGWRAEPAEDVLDLPGVGLCVPDLRFVHEASGAVVFLEVLGFWSREAVWKRVELVQARLPYRVLFAVPRRLRVSEDVLDDELPGRLYVYKGKMNARAVVERLEELARDR